MATEVEISSSERVETQTPRKDGEAGSGHEQILAQSPKPPVEVTPDGFSSSWKRPIIPTPQPIKTKGDKLRVMCAVLTSGDLKRTLRCIESIERQRKQPFDLKRLVVVNTTNKGFRKEAKREIPKHFPQWNVIVTPSNGKPGRGKNSVLEHFSMVEKNADDTAHDYLFQFDGDDFLYPTAFEMIEKSLIGLPDIVGFHTVDVLIRKRLGGLDQARLGGKDIYLNTHGNREVNLRDMTRVNYRWIGDNEFRRTRGQIYTPNTSMILSRRAVCNPEIRHNEEFTLFEDYLFCLKCFKLFLDGKLSYRCINNSWIYVYDRTNGSSVCAQDPYYTEQTMKTLFDYHDDQGMQEYHINDVEFLALGVPDGFVGKDKVRFAKEMLHKFPVEMYKVVYGD